MKEIDRRGRTTLRLIMWGMWLLLHGLFSPMVITAHTGDNPQTIYISYVIMFVLFTFGVLYSAHYKTPRVYFSDEGVYIKRFIWKKFYAWGEFQESVIFEQVSRTKYGKRVFYYFYFLTMGGTPLSPADKIWAYKRRNSKYLLQVPLTDESRECAKKHNLRLVIDQSEGKEILWRLVK